jgi:hypothetical protein
MVERKAKLEEGGVRREEKGERRKEREERREDGAHCTIPFSP